MTYTPVHNRFWSDGWVRGLNALDRYLFLYLLTNGRARLTGIYELPLDLMAAESGIDEKDLKNSMLNRLEPKIFYREGWVIIINYPKHHIAGGHKFNQGLKSQFEEIPRKIQDISKGYGYPIDTLSMEYLHFPDRIEENRIIPANADFEIKEVRVDKEGREKTPKPNDEFLEKYEALLQWSEKRRGFKFVNRVKQYSAFKKARLADISQSRLKSRWQQLEGDTWRTKGFDWVDVVSSFDKES